jgi:hypothetical protein
VFSNMPHYNPASFGESRCNSIKYMISCLKDGHGSSQHEERARNSIGFADLANGRDSQKRLRQSENFLPFPKSCHVDITRVKNALSLCQAAFRSSASNVSFGVGLKV